MAKTVEEDDDEDDFFGDSWGDAASASSASQTKEAGASKSVDSRVDAARLRLNEGVLLGR